MCGGLLFVLVFVLMSASFCLFFYKNKWDNILIGVCGIILFSVYVIYDTQLIVGQKAFKYTIDDYILASLNIYLDVLNIFMYIIQI